MRGLVAAARRRRAVLVLLLSAMFLAWSVQRVMSQRHEVRQLTQQAEATQTESRKLEYERRSLLLEYMTFTGYDNLREAAATLGLHEPTLSDGSLVFIENNIGDNS